VNPFEFVLIILFMVFAFTIIKHRLGIRDGKSARPEENAENDRLRQQVSQLQERIHVLERIVTDRGVETASQIEALRDRERIDDGDKTP
jgi:hypothetical protein